MPIHLIPLDLENDLQRDMEVINQRGGRSHSIFYIDGRWCRIGTDSRKGQEYHASHSECLVGVYTSRSSKNDIKEDIKFFREKCALECKRRVAR